MMIPDIPRGGFGPAAPPTRTTRDAPATARSIAGNLRCDGRDTMKFRSAERSSRSTSRTSTLSRTRCKHRRCRRRLSRNTQMGGQSCHHCTKLAAIFGVRTRSSTKNVPWTDEKYLKTLYDACECIGYALEKFYNVDEGATAHRCLVNTLRQIIRQTIAFKTRQLLWRKRSGNDANPLVEDMKICHET